MKKALRQICAFALAAAIVCAALPSPAMAAVREDDFKTVYYLYKSDGGTVAYKYGAVPDLAYIHNTYSMMSAYFHEVPAWISADRKSYTLYVNQKFADKDRKALDFAKALLPKIVSNDMSDTQKVTAIHDWIINNCQYDLQYKYTQSDHAYGVFFNKYARCSGYSRAFMMLCQLAGVRAMNVIGQAVGSSGAPEDHMWSRVYADGSWYNVDVTFDDPVTTGKPIRLDTFLLVDDKKLSATHTWDRDRIEILNEYIHYDTDTSAAQLQRIGVMNGSGGDLKLDSAATRIELVLMLLRLKGESAEAKKELVGSPFADTPVWPGGEAEFSLGYAYKNGYVRGITAKRFDPNAGGDLRQYSVMLLRAMGYSEGRDFAYNTADTDAVRLGLITEARRQAVMGRGLLRADVALMSCNALLASIPGGGRLVDNLLASGTVSKTAYAEFVGGKAK